MIDLLSISNFRSIDELELPLSFGESKAPNGFRESPALPFLECRGVRAVPCLALYGANASGKSNLLMSFAALKRLLAGHDRRLYMPNRIQTGNDRTAFRILGVASGKWRFEYEISYDGERLLSERLSSNGETLFSADGDTCDFSGIAMKFYEPERLRECCRVECLDADGRQKWTILERFGTHYPGLSPALAAVLKELRDGLDVFESNYFDGREALLLLASLLGGDRGKAFSEITALLQSLDIGIRKMEWREESSETLPFAESVDTWHADISGREVPFKLSEESRGTRSSFGLAAVCLAARHSGRTLVIDELDTSLHPLLAAELVRLFRSRDRNRHGAQLVFSAHSTDLLDRGVLRVSEVGIVDKTAKRGTTLRRLCDFEGLRNVTDFRRRYLEGRFAGIPFPHL